MPKLPDVTPRELIRALTTLGFSIVSQRGSHIKMRHNDGRTAIIPDHKSLKKGTLKKGILNPLHITVQELLSALKK